MVVSMSDRSPSHLKPSPTRRRNELPPLPPSPTCNYPNQSIISSVHVSRHSINQPLNLSKNSEDILVHREKVNRNYKFQKLTTIILLIPHETESMKVHYNIFSMNQSKIKQSKDEIIHYIHLITRLLS